ncbi:acyl-CoA dehydrogenase family protein [Glaciibacter sp. 2TAF33]|uniref:acyl-CoA dehydrogenase family protein n=1 Tax=Glaciibacter sp. 2TAF33 TaxID=3233015 RepID=UPI003F8FA3E1
MPINQNNPFVVKIREHAEQFRAEAVESEKIGRLSDKTVERMRELGVVRMLQPRAFGGYETDPQTFLEATYTLASLSGAAGWVGGVVGLHPWEIGQLSETVQREVWGADPDTWISSPYAPIGRGKDCDGGLTVSGRWPFASGTDHCSWAILGGVHVDRPDVPLHFLIPKADYTIDHDSWDVTGLRGTGSKDLVAIDTVVSNERIVVADSISHGNADASWETLTPLYRMPFWVLFPAAIATATLGIAQGAVDAYQRAVLSNAERSGRFSQSPAQLAALATAASEIDASFLAVRDGVNRAYDSVSAGRSVTLAERLETRRDQTVGVRRSFDAVIRLYQEAGSLGIRSSNEFSRFFRDLSVGAEHHSNSPELYLRGYASMALGQPIPSEIRIGPAPDRDWI